jgi:hypothetical protein
VQERSLALEDVIGTLMNALPRRGFSVELSQPRTLELVRDESPQQVEASVKALTIRQPNGGAATVTAERLPDRVLTSVVRLPRCRVVIEGDEEFIEVINMTLMRGGG